MLWEIFLPKQYFLLDQIFLAVTGLPLVCQPQIPLSTTAAFCSLHPPFLYTSIYKHTLTYKTQLSTSLTWFHIVLKYLLFIFSSFFVRLFPPHISYLIFFFVLNYCPIIFFSLSFCMLRIFLSLLFLFLSFLFVSFVYLEQFHALPLPCLLARPSCLLYPSNQPHHNDHIAFNTVIIMILWIRYFFGLNQ